MPAPLFPEPSKEHLDGLHFALETQLEAAQQQLSTGCAFARRLRLAQEETFRKIEEEYWSLAKQQNGVHVHMAKSGNGQQVNGYDRLWNEPIREGDERSSCQPLMLQVGQPLMDTTPAPALGPGGSAANGYHSISYISHQDGTSSPGYRLLYDSDEQTSLPSKVDRPGPRVSFPARNSLQLPTQDIRRSQNSNNSNTGDGSGGVRTSGVTSRMASMPSIVRISTLGSPSKARLSSNGSPARERVSFSEDSSSFPPGDLRSSAVNVASTDVSFWEETTGKLWPASLPIREGLARRGTCDLVWLRSVATKNSHRTSQSFGIFPQLSVGSFQSKQSSDSPPPSRFVMDPTGMPRRIINRLSFLMLFYDLTVTPYMLAWHPKSFADLDFSNATWSEKAALFSTFFWFLEAVASFFTGYYDAGLGEVTLSFELSSLRYLKTWFAFDVVMLAGNVIAHIVDQWIVQSSMGSLHTLRIVKCRAFLKAWKILRIFKMHLILLRLVDQTTSDALKMAVEVGKICLALIWLSHIICCAFFAVSQWAPSDTGQHWLQFRLENLPTLESSGEMYQYFTVFHWSMAQITSGQMEYFPLNTPERSYTIICQLFGLIFGSYLIGRISTMMIELEQSHTGQKNQLFKLCQFMQTHGISKTSFANVTRQAKERLARPAPWTYQELKISPVVKLLSENLRSKIFYETLGPHISRHPLIRVWSQLDEPSFQRLTLEAVDMRHCSAGDEVIATAETALAAYMVIDGELLYTRDTAFITLTADPYLRASCKGRSRVSAMSSRGRQQNSVKVREGDWLAEIALWANWFHVGRAVAVVDSRLLLVNPSKFAEIVIKSAMVKDLAVEFASRYYQFLITARPPQTAWPDDVGVAGAEFSDIIVTMDESARKLISDIALRHIIHNTHIHSLFHHDISKANRALLERGIDEGTVILVQDASGEVYRCVHLAVVRALDENDNVLMKLATINEAECKLEPKGALPGTLQEGEFPTKAFDKLLEQDFGDCSQTFKLSGLSREVNWRVCSHYGVNTKFTRNVGEVRVSGVCPCLGQRLKYISSASGKQITFTDENDFQEREVFTIQSLSGTVGIYAWMTQSEYDFLQGFSKESKVFVNQWLSGLDVFPEQQHQVDMLGSMGKSASVLPEESWNLSGSVKSPVTPGPTPRSYWKDKLKSTAEDMASLIWHRTSKRKSEKEGTASDLTSLGRRWHG